MRLRRERGDSTQAEPPGNQSAPAGPPPAGQQPAPESELEGVQRSFGGQEADSDTEPELLRGQLPDRLAPGQQQNHSYPAPGYPGQGPAGNWPGQGDGASPGYPSSYPDQVPYPGSAPYPGPQAGPEGYAEQQPYPGPVGYDGQGGYEGHGGYEGQSGYEGRGGYGSQGYPDGGPYAGQGDYPGQGQYAAQGDYSGQGPYGGQGDYAEQGPYAGQGPYPGQGQGEYADQGPYPGHGDQGGQYGQPGPYGDPAGYPGQELYPAHGGYPGSSSGQGGYPGPGPQQGQGPYGDPAQQSQRRPLDPFFEQDLYREQAPRPVPGQQYRDAGQGAPTSGASPWAPAGSAPAGAAPAAGATRAGIPGGVVQLPRPGQAGGPPAKKRRSRALVALGLVVALIAVVALAGGGYLLLRTKGSPKLTATTYLDAWQAGSFGKMAHVSVGVPKGGLAAPLTAVATELGVRSQQLTLGDVTTAGSTAQAHFTVTDSLASSHVWTYHDALQLVKRNRQWWVRWSPAAIYPGLTSGERFALTSAWPARAPILDANGNVLSSQAAFSQSGSIALMTGIVAPATKAQAKKLGAPYKAGDPVGLGGIEQAYQAQLAGRPSLTISIVGPGKRTDGTAVRFAAANGTPVKTSIVMTDQAAASQAVSQAKTKLPVDMVVVQPSTGRILAMVEKPGGFDRALDGIFPPGSTFKVVTASALARTGLTPTSSVQCPATYTVDGRTLHNNDNEHYGTTTFINAFAVSCNSTFAMLADQRLTGVTLRDMAAVYGFNAKPALGIQAQLGHFYIPHSQLDLAADAFGQGTDLVNPLSQATMAAAVDAGTWHPPLLVTSPLPRQTAKPHAINPLILATLRPLMRAVVTNGTAAGVGFPPGVYGKTGTAEYGNGPHPKDHAWFIGYDGDVAFAVLVEGGGYGATAAAPIANAFLKKIGY